MTRKDLSEKTIERLDGMKDALDLINILEYDECIEVLKRVKRMPPVMHKALMDRAKSLKGATFELMIAGMQAAVN